MQQKYFIISISIVMLIIGLTSAQATWYYRDSFLCYDATTERKPHAITADTAGNIYYTTYYMPAFYPAETMLRCYKVVNPLSPSRTFFAFDSASWQAGRGFHGVAVDTAGNIYLAGENNGGASPHRIRKYDKNFNLLYEVNPSYRAHGIGVDNTGHIFVSNLANSPGAFHTYNTSDLTEIGTSPASNSAFMRQLVVDAVRNIVYTARNGWATWGCSWNYQSIDQWTGGNGGNPSGYSMTSTIYFKQYGDDTNPAMNEEALGFDAIHNQIVFPRTAENVVMVIDTVGNILQMLGVVGESGSDSDHFDVPDGCAVASINGNPYLFICDSMNYRIKYYWTIPPLSLLPTTPNINLHLVDSTEFVVSGGQPPYTWSITTSSGNPGYLTAYTGATVMFVSVNTGSCYLTASDNAGQTLNSGTISVIATDAPLAIQPAEVLIYRSVKFGELFD